MLRVVWSAYRVGRKEKRLIYGWLVFSRDTILIYRRGFIKEGESLVVNSFRL